MRRTVLAAITAALLGVCLQSKPARAYYDYTMMAPTYQYAGTFQSAVSNCDDCSVVVNLPWAFPFYGRTFTQITVSSNGYIVMGNNTGWGSLYSNNMYTRDGTGSAPPQSIAVLWDDWNTAAGGSVYTGMVGSAFVVEWFAMYHYGQTTGSSNSFEIKLFPDGTFELHYGNLVSGNSWDNGASATIGYQDDVDTIGHNFSYNSWYWTSYSKGFRFVRPGNVALYAKATSTFYPGAPQIRAGQHFRMTYGCYLTPSVYTSGTLVSPATSTATEGYVRATGGSCSNAPADLLPPEWSHRSDYLDVMQVGGPWTKRNGNYYYYKNSNFTPAPTQVSYFAREGRNAELYYWASGTINKPLVVIPGFDPNDEDGPAKYLALMAAMARPMLAEGYDIAIGNWAWGDRDMSVLREQASTFILDAYNRNIVSPIQDRRVQVIGVSMGGILLRDALARNEAGSFSATRAWYSVDAPLEGANLGRADYGIQSLIMCNKPPTDPQYRSITSRPAAQMLYEHTWAVVCDDEPENGYGYGDSWDHDQYYNNVGVPPTTIPRYAVAFGDATTFARMSAGGPLFDFHYGGWACTEDRDFSGSPRDCLAGSYYLTAAKVDQDQDHWLCGHFTLRLRWHPAFINVDSALMANTSNWFPPNTYDSSCSSTYGSFSAPYWTGTWVNNTNATHELFPTGAVNPMLSWLRTNGGDGGVFAP